MPITLWRGAQLLGELRMDSPATSSAGERPRQFHRQSAFLIPAEGAALEGIQQGRISFLNKTWVFQDPIEPSISSREDTPALPRKNRPFTELEPMPPDKAGGVPLAAQLRLVGDDGEELDTRAIWLHESRYDPDIFSLIQNGIPGVPMEPIPAEAYVAGSVWTVMFAFDPPST